MASISVLYLIIVRFSPDHNTEGLEERFDSRGGCAYNTYIRLLGKGEKINAQQGACKGKHGHSGADAAE